LRAGQGAEADILTKMIRPKVALPHNNPRSRVVIIDRVEEKGKHRFIFHFVGADETQLFNGSDQYVSIIKEGNPLLFFNVIESNNNNNNNSKFEEPEIGWVKSKARKLLYMDVKTGMGPLDTIVDRKRTTDNNDVFIMHEECASWSYKSFHVDWQAYGVLSKQRMAEQKTIRRLLVNLSKTMKYQQ
jgi:hypothetical protein